MKRLIAAAAVLLLAAAIVMIVSDAKKASRASAPAECERTYVFRDCGGYVACFELGSDEPFLVTDKPTRELTPLDREMLSRGVEVHGAKAMTRALEDYTN